MTTAPLLTSTSTSTSTPTDRAGGPLRLVLRVNGSSSLLCGLAGLVGAGWWSGLLGVDRTWLTAAVAAALVVVGVDVLWLSTRPDRLLRTGALVVSALDAAWVAATAAVVAAGALTTTGTVLAVAVGLLVADLGLAQVWFRRRLAG